MVKGCSKSLMPLLNRISVIGPLFSMLHGIIFGVKKQGFQKIIYVRDSLGVWACKVVEKFKVP